MTINNSVSDKEITVSFELAKTDFANLLRSSGWNWRAFRPAPVILFVFIGAEIYRGDPATNIAYSVVGMVIIISLWAWVIFRLLPWVSRFFSRRRNPSGAYTIRIDADGVYDESEFDRSAVPWNGIANVTQNPNYVLIYKDWVNAHVVPKHAFPSPDKAEVFYDTAHTLWKSAKQQAKS